jgi:ABC-type multidrug transport system fused ATPase/permease subunit
VHRYLELMSSLNSLITGFQDTLLATRAEFEKGAAESLARVRTESQAASAQLGEKANQVLQAVDKKLQETTEKFNATLAEAAMYKEQTKEQYEASRDYYQQQAMTEFGAAFNKEANTAEEKAKAANRRVFVFIGILVVAITLFFFIEVAGWGLTTADPKDLWRWSMLRISLVAFFAWFIGHFFRERKNFLHVAVANRHRRNLCNAYVAFAEKMSPEERTKYLEEIVPQLAVLGKTGFISKEDVPDMPGGQVLKTCLEALKAK